MESGNHGKNGQVAMIHVRLEELRNVIGLVMGHFIKAKIALQMAQGKLQSAQTALVLSNVLNILFPLKNKICRQYTTHFTAQTGSCPDTHYHSFRNGYFCCKIYRSEINPTITLGNDQGEEHCSEENTVACPSAPGTRCKVKDISTIKMSIV